MPRRLTSCDQHTVNDLGYLAFHEDAERRMARGERQYRCAECGLWQWPEPSNNDTSAVTQTAPDSAVSGRHFTEDAS